MSDTTPYPRKTVSTILAALAGSIAAVLVTLSIGGGTVITKHLRTAATINVESIAASSATTSAVTLTGATVAGDCKVEVVSGDFLSSTSTGNVDCKFTAADTATLYFRNTSSTAAFDAASSVFSVQAWAY